MSQETGEQSRARILRAAETVFAEKGFDGARVDEIARVAGVTKALIYYYFKGKEELLQELLSRWVKQLVTILGDPVEIVQVGASRDKTPAERETAWRTMFRQVLRQAEKEKSLLAIIMGEMLKSSEKKSFILQSMSRVIRETQITALEASGVTEETEQLITTDFFTKAIPIIVFVLLKDSWATTMHMSDEEIEERFFKAFAATHGRYVVDLIESHRT